MENFSLGSGMLVLAGIGIFMLLVSFIFIIRHYYLAKFKNNVKANSVSDTRNKYAAVNVFRYRGIFFRIGLAVALGMVTLAFSWTQYENQIYTLTDISMLDEIEIEIPRTTPPTPPPVLPPPVIEAVPEDILPDDQPDYIDIFLQPDTIFEAPAPVKKEPTYVPPPPKIEEPPGETIFVVAEDMPRFPGCEELATKKEKEACATTKLLEFIYKNIKYPPIARENGIEGTVVISFVVEKNGKIADAKVLRDIGGSCGQEALRIINLMNQQNQTWRPGMQRGVPVRVQFNLPIKFKLQ